MSRIGTVLENFTKIPNRGAPTWRRLPADLRDQIEAYKPELKAYVLKRAAEWRRTLGQGA